MAGPSAPQLALSRVAKYVKADDLSTMLTDSAASARLSFFFFWSDLLGVTTSVGSATFNSTVFGPATSGAKATVGAALEGCALHHLLHCNEQSSATHKAPQSPSVTHEPQPNPRCVQACASNLSDALFCALAEPATAGFVMTELAGAGMAAGAGAAAVVAFGAAHATTPDEISTQGYR